MNKEKLEKLSVHEDIYEKIGKIERDLIIINIVIIFILIILGILIVSLHYT